MSEMSEESSKSSEEVLKSISIAELNREKVVFVIPPFQRGYRWTTNAYPDNQTNGRKGEIEQLLDDLWDFADPAKDKWNVYCLQPVVLQRTTLCSPRG